MQDGNTVATSGSNQMIDGCAVSTAWAENNKNVYKEQCYIEARNIINTVLALEADGVFVDRPLALRILKFQEAAALVDGM